MGNLFSKKLILLFSLFLLPSCTSVKEIIKEVPVEVVKEVEKKVFVHDTTYTKDSVIVYQKGDTIFKDKVVFKYVGKTVHDTLAVHDTVPKPVYNTEIKTVNKPQWWPVWLMLGALIAGGIVYAIYKFKDKILKWII